MEEKQAAIKIQSVYRGKAERGRYKKLKDQKLLEEADKLREKETQEQLQKLEEERLKKLEKIEKDRKKAEKKAEKQLAAIKIQSRYRGNKARLEVENRRKAQRAELKKLKELEREKAAIKIQSKVRSKQAQARVNKIRSEKKKASSEVAEEDAKQFGEMDDLLGSIENSVDELKSEKDKKKASKKIDDKEGSLGASFEDDIKFDFDDGSGEPILEISGGEDPAEIEKATLTIQKHYRNKKENEKKSDKKKPTKKVGFKEDEFDIDMEADETKNAAIKIQSSFRKKQKARKTGFPINKKLSDVEDLDDDETKNKVPKDEEFDIDMDAQETKDAAVKIQTKFRENKKKGKKERPQSGGAKPKKGSIDIDMDAPETTNAALKIQNQYRKQKNKGNNEAKQGKNKPKKEAEEIDIDMDAPETTQAALKIQNQYRKKKTNNQNGEKKSNTAAEKKQEPEEIDIDMDAPETTQAALKIQNQYRKKKNNNQEKSKKDKKVPEKKQEAKDEIDIDMDAPETTQAALKIQNQYRKKQNKNQQGEKKDKDASKQKQQPIQGEIDIDMDAPETTKAAIKIQNQYRKKNNKQKKAEKNLAEKIDIDLEDPEVQNAAVKIQNQYRVNKANQGKPKFDKKKRAKSEEKIDIDLEDPETEKAAFVIQNKYRQIKSGKKKAPQGEKDTAGDKAKSEDIDIDMEAEETKNAALVIQRNYRSKKTKHHQPESINKGKKLRAKSVDEIDIDMEAEDTKNAALKIQSRYRGQKAREEVKNLKKTKKSKNDPLLQKYQDPKDSMKQKDPLNTKFDDQKQERYKKELIDNIAKENLDYLTASLLNKFGGDSLENSQQDIVASTLEAKEFSDYQSIVKSVDNSQLGPGKHSIAHLESSQIVEEFKPTFANEILQGTLKITILDAQIRDKKPIADEFSVYVAGKIKSNSKDTEDHSKIARKFLITLEFKTKKITKAADNLDFNHKIEIKRQYETEMVLRLINHFPSSKKKLVGETKINLMKYITMFNMQIEDVFELSAGKGKKGGSIRMAFDWVVDDPVSLDDENFIPPEFDDAYGQIDDEEF